jgi:hypothetical protein
MLQYIEKPLMSRTPISVNHSVPGTRFLNVVKNGQPKIIREEMRLLKRVRH